MEEEYVLITPLLNEHIHQHQEYTLVDHMLDLRQEVSTVEEEEETDTEMSVVTTTVADHLPHTTEEEGEDAHHHPVIDAVHPRLTAEEGLHHRTVADDLHHRTVADDLHHPTAEDVPPLLTADVDPHHLTEVDTETKLWCIESVEMNSFITRLLDLLQ